MAVIALVRGVVLVVVPGLIVPGLIVGAVIVGAVIVVAVIVGVVRLGHEPMSHRIAAGSMRGSPDQRFSPPRDRRETG